MKKIDIADDKILAFFSDDPNIQKQKLKPKDSLTYNDIIKAEERERNQEKINKLDNNKMIDKYQENQIKISNLSQTKYQKLTNSKQSQIINTVPNLSQQEILNHRKEIPFLSFEEIQQINKKLITESYSQQVSGKSIQNKNPYLLFQKCKNTSIFQNQNSEDRNSTYSQKQLVQFELIHNKNQLQTLNQLNYHDLKHKFNKALHLNQKYDKICQSQPVLKIYDTEEYKHAKKQKKQISIDQNEDDKNNIQINQQRQSISVINNEIEIQKYYAYWYDFNTNGWKPSPREYFTMSIIGNRLFLFGGIGIQNTNEICILDIKKLLWSKIKMKGEIPKLSRYGHSQVSYKKKLIIYGGIEENRHEKEKNIDNLGEIRTFNTETCEWQLVRAEGNYIYPRRHHACCIVGKYMFVHGGINDKKIYLNDLFIYDINQQRWSAASMDNPPDFLSQGIAHHSCCSVFHANRKNIQIYKVNEEKSDTVLKIKQEGIYFFGGINQLQTPQNGLIALKIDTKPFGWVKIETKGQQPCARYNTVLNYSENLQLLFVFNGRNDAEGGFLDDMFVFYLDKYQWQKVYICGFPRVPRALHLSFIVESRLYIFGGINIDGFCSLDVNIMEINSRLAQKIYNQQQNLAPIEVKGKDRRNELYKQNSNAIDQELMKLKMEKELANDLVKKQREKAKQDELTVINSIKKIKQFQNIQKQQIQSLKFINHNSHIPMPLQKSQALLNIEKSLQKNLQSEESQDLEQSLEYKKILKTEQKQKKQTQFNFEQKEIILPPIHRQTII